MSLSEESLRRVLAREFRFFRRVDSSNDLAKTWLMEGAGAGAVVIADEQLKGRGRQNRHWRSPPGKALALSVILKPKPAHAAAVNMLGALSVYDLASRLGCPDVGIKWPNDVQIAGRKVSGLLAENVWQGERLLGVVLGIGVNVRIDFAGTELANRAISLEDLTRRRLDRAELLRDLLERVDFWHARSPDEIFRAWKRRMNMLGSAVKLDGFSGIALDVTPAGALLVKSDSSEIRPVVAGDVFTFDGTGSAL